MIAGLKPYATYKDSGVPWLGEVPAHWKLTLLKWVSDRSQNGSTPSTSEMLYYEDGSVPWYGPSSCGTAEEVGQPMRHLSQFAFTKGGARLVRGPALLVVVIGSVGRMALMPHDGSTNQQITAFEFSANRVNPSFMLRQLRNAEPWLRATASATTIPILNSDVLARLSCATPSLPEQTAIVRFLDHADRRIQRYIRAKQKLMELLEEQKQTIVHQAVTGQIDVRTGQPYPATKPSGVEWLGDVPTHWDLCPAKWYFREVDERSETGSEELLSVSHITGVTPRSEKNVTMFKAESNVGYKLCRPGDLVINTMWAWMAALGVSKQAGIVSPSYAVYRPHPSSRLLGNYADLLLRTTTYKNEYICRSTGIRSSRLRLYPEEVLRIKLLCPPLEDQHAIVEFTSKKSTNARRAIDLAHDELSLLREYRTRLIADAVTGKLDVREAAARLPDGEAEPKQFDTAEALIDAANAER